MVFKDIKNCLDVLYGIKTSKEWHEILKEKCKVEIIDPDGWDRQNFNFSFNVEKIDSTEFINRLELSTLKFNV